MARLPPLLALLLTSLACAAPGPPGAAPGPSEALSPLAPPLPPATTEPAASAPPPAPASAAAPPPSVAAPRKRKEKSLEDLKTEARKDLGERVSFELVREVYLVVSAPSWGQAGARGSAVFIERVLKALHNNRFARGPTRPLPVYLFGDAASYNAYCKRRYNEPCVSIYGFFSHSDDRLVMNLGLGIGTLSHELVHPILDVDFPAAPTWINEGIASLYEAPLMPRDGEIHGAKNWRYPRLQNALASPDKRAKVTLPALFALSDEDFRGDDEGLHYATARYVCQWLDAQEKLWPFYQAWRDGYEGDPRGEKAFAKVMGKTPAEASDAWLRWARSL